MPYRPKQFDPRPRPAGRKIPTFDPAGRERSGFYNSAAWRRLRDAFLRANPVCERCLAADKVEPATVAHHRAERLARPDLALDAGNLEALCASCHSAHHKGGPAGP